MAFMISSKDSTVYRSRTADPVIRSQTTGAVFIWETWVILNPLKWPSAALFLGYMSKAWRESLRDLVYKDNVSLF